MNKILLVLCTVLWMQGIKAQQVTHVIENATIHLGNGQTLPNGVVVFEQGKIIYVGTQLDARYKNATYIDAKNQHVYPGLICMNTILGLNEIDAVRATRDFQEVGSINPNVRSLIAYNTDSKLTPTALYNGILYIQTVPTGGILSGSSSVVRTKAWNWEDAAVVADDGIHLRWPALRGLSYKAKEQRTEQLAQLREFMAQALAYLNSNTPQAPNMRMEAMRGVFAGKKNLYVHADAANDMLDAMQFLTPYKHLNIVWVGASQAHLIVNELKDFGKPVVLDITHRLPSTNHEDVDLPYKLPAILWQAGIKVALAHGGSWEARNLMFNAGTAAAYGLTREQALQLITQHPAEILGAANEIGTIAVGKQASLIISTGDLLDMKSSHITKAFLDGEQIEVTGEQQQLYKKFMKKYGLTEPERK